MSLAEQLSALKARLEAKRSPEALAIMHRAVDDLRLSGILSGVVRVGERMPSFTLPDADGRLVSSSALLARSALVVTFYRGKW